MNIDESSWKTLRCLIPQEQSQKEFNMNQQKDKGASKSTSCWSG